jgi:hypothetical protein
MLLFAVMVASLAHAQSVYIATSNGAVAYHKSRDCGYLNNAKTVRPVSLSDAKEMGRHACTACYGKSEGAATKSATRAAASRKTVAKDNNADELPVTKKSTTARKSAKKVQADAEKEVKDAKADTKKAVTKAKKTVKKSASDAEKEATAAKKTVKKTTKKAAKKTTEKTVKEAA